MKKMTDRVLLVFILLVGAGLKSYMEHPTKEAWVFYDNAAPTRR